MSSLVLRAEQPGDYQAIRTLVAAAFAGDAHSDGSEPDIIEGLRAAGDMTLALVADEGGPVGHIAFSPVGLSCATPGWFGLGPLAVTPARQGQGIGDALARAGLAELERRGAAGCVVLGDPAYYGRFGFRHEPALRYPGAPVPYFQALAFNGSVPEGEVRYAPAFG